MSKLDFTNSVLPDGWRGSTYRNPTVRTYEDLANRIKVRLGYPYSQVNVTDEAIANAIDESIELYSRYAGYDREYIVFCDKALDYGCSIKLDEVVANCLCDTSLSSNEYLSSDTIETTYVSSTEVSSNLIGTSDSILSAYSNLSAGEFTGSIQITYNPNDPWEFDISEVNHITINPVSSYDDQVPLSPKLDAWIKVEDGVAEFYPVNWESLDKCAPLSSWWGVGVGDLSSFDPINASHIIVGKVPSNTIGGLQPLNINTGKGGTFYVENQNLDTGGYIVAEIEFVKNFELPTNLSGDFDIDFNNGFRLSIDINDLVQTKFNIPVNVEFYENVSSFEYGVSVVPYDIYNDYDFDKTRKVSGVFDVSPMGTNNFGNTLFSFDYIIAQQTFGYNGVGGRNFNRYGYDIVSHELSMQYIEMVRERFGGGSKTNFDFDPLEQRLRIFKNQNKMIYSNNCYLVGIYLERSVNNMITETWVHDYATALTKIIMGNNLTKFGGTTIGGLQINGNDLLSQGLAEKEELLTWLRKTKSEGGINTPFYIH